MAAAAYAYGLSVSVEMHNLNLQKIKRHVLIASTLQSNQYLYYLYLEAKANKSGTTTCNEEYHDFITIALYAVNVTTNL